MTTNKININQVNQKYGYIRVSSKSQESNSSIESQTKKLIRQGIPKKNLRIEVGSAANAIHNRPVFQKLIEEELQENDLLMVTKIDRCSRNTLEFLKLQDNLFQRSITFVALDISHSNDLATNKLIATRAFLFLPHRLKVYAVCKFISKTTITFINECFKATGGKGPC